MTIFHICRIDKSESVEIPHPLYAFRLFHTPSHPLPSTEVPCAEDAATSAHQLREPLPLYYSEEGSPRRGLYI